MPHCLGGGGGVATQATGPSCFKINLFKKIIYEYHQSVNSLNPDQAGCLDGLDLVQTLFTGSQQKTKLATCRQSDKCDFRFNRQVCFSISCLGDFSCLFTAGRIDSSDI